MRGGAFLAIAGAILAAGAAAGLAPHGIPGLAALVLACGTGLSGAAAAGKRRLFVRAVAPLLAGAAGSRGPQGKRKPRR